MLTTCVTYAHLQVAVSVYMQTTVLYTLASLSLEIILTFLFVAVGPTLLTNYDKMTQETKHNVSASVCSLRLVHIKNAQEQFSVRHLNKFRRVSKIYCTVSREEREGRSEPILRDVGQV